uniref:Uncharacterized protein n=1 Tax=Ditylenchus dipsaci TaxID=166011 RepID=A0A915D8W2_9BILA
MEPRVAQSNGISHRTFHIYDIHLFKSDKTFGLTKVKQSNPVPRSILQMHKSGYIQQSRTHLQNGMLYKFYANYCLTMFLRIPTLQEAAFVGLQKMWMTEQDKVLFDGISQEQLIQELDINAIWF